MEGEDSELKLLNSEENGRFMGFRRRERVTGMAFVASPLLFFDIFFSICLKI